ncbi:MAG: heat-inducible transcriptional repressor HrcA [Erysipelotrichaceae bacterium]
MSANGGEGVEVQLTQRQTEIFRIIVEVFIKTAEPVGSKALLELMDVKLSSATIRNEMASLEEAGLLEKTHTSSGRVPSTQGYRYYVDHLMEKTLDDSIKYSLANIFDERHYSMDEIIRKSCDILSQMTNLTTVVLGPDATHQRLQHIQLVPISAYSAVAIFITDTGHTESKTFQFDQQISVEDTQTCCNILNEQLAGLMLGQIVEKMDEIKPLLKMKIVHHEMLFQAFVSAFIKFASDTIYLSGKSNMLYQPEFADIEKLKRLMRLLEDSSVWRSFAPSGKALSVQIGNQELEDMAIISSKVHFSNTEEGQLMIVGPNRMPYKYLVALLEYVSERIEAITNQK